jgi:hypothetical protein
VFDVSAERLAVLVLLELVVVAVAGIVVALLFVLVDSSMLTSCRPTSHFSSIISWARLLYELRRMLGINYKRKHAHIRHTNECQPESESCVHTFAKHVCERK